MSLFSATSSSIVNATLLVLLGFSVVTWSILLLKLYQQWRDRQDDRYFNAEFWAAQTWPQAAAVSNTMSGRLAYLAKAGYTELRNAARHGNTMQHTGTPQEGLERGLRLAVQDLQRQLERGLTTLASIGSTAPFVGLFGTVWGIMHALQNISASGSASLDVVAGPIGESLIATAIGIATALPAVLAYNYLLRRTRLAVADLGNFSHDFMRLAAKHDYKLYD